MGRSRRNRNSTRGNFSTARRSRRYTPVSTSSRYDYLPDLSVDFRPDLRLVEDMRRWSPSSSPKNLFGGGYTLKPTPNVNVSRQTGSVYKTFQPSAGIGFARPQSMTVCERRSRRRQSIFANKKNGRGGQRKPRWSEFSYVQCKRRK